ncbi:hypothetical protein D3C80_1064690 [compost metagenome]
MLELTGRIGFGMDIGNFLELECPFHRHRELRTTAQEQRVMLVCEQFSGFLDDGVHRQGFAQARRQAA